MASNCLTPPKLNQHISDAQKRINSTSFSTGKICSARHVNYENSAQQCRFAYATWCPVCEEEERSKRIDSVSRRRSKSEGMDIERSDFFYSKSLVTEPNEQYGVSLTRDHQVNRKLMNNQHNFETSSYFNVSKQGEFITSRKHPSSRHLSDYNSEKCMKSVHRPCENHVEPNRLHYEAWDRFASDRIPRHRENQSGAPLHERYYYEVELLRSKIHEMRDKSILENKSTGFCGSEHFPQFSLESGLKRPRDISPSAVVSTTSRKLPTVPTTKPSRSKSALLPRDVSITSGLLSSSSATSISSDSEYNDSGCEEEDLKDSSEIECEEDESLLFASSSTNLEFAKSPSHLVNSISIGDADDGKLHPALRASLFSHVPPYIRFSTHDVKGSMLPVTIQKLLKWKLSTITPLVVRKTVVNSNFKLVRKSNEWCGTWGKHMKSICFKTIREYQKINHFPGTFQIGRKDRLWKNLFRLMAKFGKKEFGFIPRTYVLPQDSKLLRSAWEKNCGKERWIVKPPASARGTGIKVIHKWTQIPKKCPLVVQKYIADPYLINGSKFDLRLYVLVSSINPLRIYIYDNGLVRFASVKYSNDMTSLADRYMHLTNYSINKLSSQYTQNEDAEACQGHKWSLQAMWNYMEEQGVDTKQLWSQLVDLVIKTVISGESAISQLSQANLASRYCSYELFGVDVLLDQNLKPWLLEVNISPSLHSSSPLDLAVKGPLVRDLMNMAGYQIPAKLSSQAQADLGESVGLEAGEGLCYDRRLYTTALSTDERVKHIRFEQCEGREDYLDTVLQDLTPDDVRHLVQYEDELTQIGNFQKIFPTTETHSYHQFFEAPRYYNMLFDAWEVKQSKDRSKGITLLESLCQKQVHLDTTQIPPKRTKVCTSLNGSESVMPEAEAELQVVEEAVRAPVPDRLKTTSLNVGTIWRAVRSRSGKPGVVTKPYPRSAYIARRCLKTSSSSSLKTTLT